MLCRRLSVCLWYCGHMYVIYAQFTASVGHFEAALLTLFPRDILSQSAHVAALCALRYDCARRGIHVCYLSSTKKRAERHFPCSPYPPLTTGPQTRTCGTRHPTPQHRRWSQWFVLQPGSAFLADTPRHVNVSIAPGNSAFGRTCACAVRAIMQKVHAQHPSVHNITGFLSSKHRAS